MLLALPNDLNMNSIATVLARLISSELLLDFDKDRPLCQLSFQIDQMYESITLPKTVQSHTSPRSQIVPPNLIVPDREPDKGQLIHHTGYVVEVEPLPGEIEITSAVRLGPRLVLALALVPVRLVDPLAQLQRFTTVDVDLDLDVGLEPGGAGVSVRQGDGLGGEEGDAEIEPFPYDGVWTRLGL